LSFCHLPSLKASIGHFYFAQIGHYHFAATEGESEAGFFSVSSTGLLAYHGLPALLLWRYLLVNIALKSLSASARTLLRENDGLSFADWVADEAPLVKPVHRIPVEAFPGSAFVMQRQEKQGQNGLVDFPLID
jgi:hypothetical protein